MIIEFTMENFRSIYDKVIFSMEKGLKRDKLETIIHADADKAYSLLPNKVVYGVNASGKTTILLALITLKQIILAGEIREDTRESLLPTYHFIHEEESFYKPFTLSIAYLDHQTRYDYTLKIENIELENTLSSVVCYEEFAINQVNVFIRDKEGVTFNKSNYSKISEHLKNISLNQLQEFEKLYQNNVSKTTVFTSWFAINADLTDRVKMWFSDKLFLFENLDEIRYDISSFKTEEDKKELAAYNNLLLRLVKEADFGPQKINLEMNESDTSTRLVSTYSFNKKKHNLNSVHIASDYIESQGTMKLIRFLAPFINIVTNGGILVVDELDSSIHPEIIAGIIKAFSNPEVNKHGAQLIFTTHNPVFLNDNLFRRDEIVFTEKDEQFKTTLFTLDNLDTRNDERYLKNYLEEKYINFSNINFSNILKELQENEED